MTSLLHPISAGRGDGYEAQKPGVGTGGRNWFDSRSIVLVRLSDLALCYCLYYRVATSEARMARRQAAPKPEELIQKLETKLDQFRDHNFTFEST